MGKECLLAGDEFAIDLNVLGPGRWIRNVRELPWRANELGSTVDFDDGVERFEELRINLTVLEPGQPMTMYTRSATRKAFSFCAARRC